MIKPNDYDVYEGSGYIDADIVRNMVKYREELEFLLYDPSVCPGHIVYYRGVMWLYGDDRQWHSVYDWANVVAHLTYIAPKATRRLSESFQWILRV